MKAPNGWFMNDLLVFNELDRRGHASKGYVLHPPDLSNASVPLLDQWEDLCISFLHNLHSELRCQIRWSVDSDYSKELLAYKHETERLPGNSWSRLIREERYQRYWTAMQKRRLRREHCSLWLSRPIQVTPDFRWEQEKHRDQYAQLIAQLDHEFSHYRTLLDTIFSSSGCRIAPMTDIDHFLAFSHFLNPSYAHRFGFNPVDFFDSEETIQKNCWHSEVQASGPNGLAGFFGYLTNSNLQIPYGFHCDGHYHNILLFKKWPKDTECGMIHLLTGLPLLDYEIVLNIQPLSTEEEILREEALINRLDNDYREERKHSLLTKIRHKDAKVQDLAEGYSRPFQVELVIHVWDASLENLQAKTQVIKQAINGMGQAQYSEINVNTTVLNLWLNIWPGWMWSPYNYRTLYAQTPFLADLLPLSATFTGDLKEAEALYDGENGNLVGMTTFNSGTPQISVAFGMTRSGKSSLVCDYLSQTHPYYADGFTVLVEEGLSYEMLTKAMGATPIIIRADSEQTFNYLDTNGLPLTSLQISTASSLFSNMAGNSESQHEVLRLAQITQYVDQIYTDVYEDWIRERDDRLPELAKTAIAVDLYKKRHLPSSATFIEAWVEFRDLKNRTQRLADEILEGITEEEITRFLKDPAKGKLVRNIAYAYFGKDQYPTHSMIYEMMWRSPFRQHDKKQIRDIAAGAAPWCADCSYGRLVDGPGTVDILGSWVHFELGFIQEHDKKLKSIANGLVANYARQHILSLPRGLRKRVVFEEVSRTLAVPGGEELVAEFYAQLSKFNTWIVSIVQQYSRFKNSSIRPIVMGNAKQFIFLRMNDRGDLKDLSHDIEMPEVTKENIMRYPLPEHLPRDKKYASATYYHMDADRPICGTLRNIVSPEMLYASSSVGEDFDGRMRELKSCPDVIEGIKKFSHQKKALKKEEAV